MLAVLVLLVGCDDRSRSQVPIRFDPPAVDAGTDAVDVEVLPEPDEICDGLLDGRGCELQNAAGVCVGERCRLVSCSSGFDDCDDQPGCETNISSEASCGRCGVECDDNETCQVGPQGYVCARGTVCPVDRYDFDGDPNNGCEGAAAWETGFTLVPPDLDVQAVRWDAAPRLAGFSEESRASVVLGGTPQPTVWSAAPDNESATAIDVRSVNGLERVVWSDGVSTERESPDPPVFLEAPCEPASVPRRFVGATDFYIATQNEVFAFDQNCAEGACLLPVYGAADYLRDFLDHPAGSVAPDPLTPDESAGCDRCLFDDAGTDIVDARCLGPRQCRSADFDPTVCGGCEPVGCPDFKIVDIETARGLLFITTARGLIVLDAMTLEPLARRESTFDPAVSGGPRYTSVLVSESSGDLRITLVHSTGEFRPLIVDNTDESLQLLPRPAFGVPTDLETASLASVGPFLGVADDRDTRVVLPTGASARTTFLTIDSGPGIQGLRPVAAVETPDGLRFLYAAAGQVFPRLVSTGE